MQVYQRKKMPRWTKILLIVIVCAAVLSLGTVVGVYTLFSYYYNKVDYKSLDTQTEDILWEVFDQTDDPYYDLTYPDVGSDTTSATSEVTASTVTDAIDLPYADPTDEYVVDPDKLADRDVIVPDGVINILLIGSDGRESSERGRSDAMILLSVNENTKQIVFTSIMRDIWVTIPQADTDNRINASYAAGGVPLLLDTIYENFRIRIDKYVRINFESFEYVIDTLGGLDIELSKEEINFIGVKMKQPGVVHLNGAQVLKFCRCRYVPRAGYTADFARTYRQREVLSLIAEKARGMSMSQFNELLNAFLPEVCTNLTQDEVWSMFTDIPSYLRYEICLSRIPVDGSWSYSTIRGMSVLTVDYKLNSKVLQEIMYGTYFDH